MQAVLLRNKDGSINLIDGDAWATYIAFYKSPLETKEVDVADELFRALSQNITSALTQKYLRELWQDGN